jgi:hypothetical protein
MTTSHLITFTVRQGVTSDKILLKLDIRSNFEIYTASSFLVNSRNR